MVREKEKLRILHGTGSPVEILNGILAGIDIFESDYPLSLASTGFGLNIAKIDQSEDQQEAPSFLSLSKSLIGKTQKTIDLSSKEENKECHEPIVTSCLCYTCLNYNRAYLYHLIEVKEMNANILIGIHNVWQYDEFFKSLRDNVGSGLNKFV